MTENMEVRTPLDALTDALDLRKGKYVQGASQKEGTHQVKETIRLKGSRRRTQRASRRRNRS